MNCDCGGFKSFTMATFVITKQYLHGSHAQLICRWWLIICDPPVVLTMQFHTFITFIQDYQSVCLHTLCYLRLSNVTMITWRCCEQLQTFIGYSVLCLADILLVKYRMFTLIYRLFQSIEEGWLVQKLLQGFIMLYTKMPHP